MDKRLFTLINKAQHRMLKFADTQCESRLGFSSTQAGALFFIAKNEGCLQKALSAATGLNQSAITGLISRMEKNGLIDRKPCSDDGRASRLYLSDKGAAKLSEIFPLLGELNTKIKGDFTEDELETVARFLNYINSSFR